MHAAPQPRADAVQAEAARLYAAHRRWVYALCRGRLRSREDAEDAVQLTFLYAFRSLQRDVLPDREFAWLRTIADNVCRTRRRDASSRSHVEEISDVHAVEHLLPARERPETDLDALRAALETLPDAQRRAVLLREWQGLSYKEIATALGLSEPAVETLLFRARRRLAHSLGDVRRALDVAAAVRLVRRLGSGAAAKGAGAAVSVGIVAATAGPPVARHVEHLFRSGGSHPHAATPSPALAGAVPQALTPQKPTLHHRGKHVSPAQAAPIGLAAVAKTPQPASAAHGEPGQAPPSPAAAPDRPTAGTTSAAPAAAPAQQPTAGVPAAAAPPLPAAATHPVSSAVDSAASTASGAASTVTGTVGQAVDTAAGAAGQAVSTGTSAVDPVTSAVPTVPAVPAVTVPAIPPAPSLP